MIRYCISCSAKFNTSILLFNVFLANLFFAVNDIDYNYTDDKSYADGNTPYMVADNVDDLITSLEQASNNLFEWFKTNL